MKRLLLTALLAAPLPVRAIETGFDFFAIEHKKFPCKVSNFVAKHYPKPHLGYLDHTFGTKARCIKKFLQIAKSKPHTLKVHISNEVCRRKPGSCQPGIDFLSNLSVDQYNQALEQGNKKILKQIRKKARKLRLDHQSWGNSNTKLLISTGLESQFSSQKAYQAVVNQFIKAGWKHDQIVHNPVIMSPYQGRTNPNHILEFHKLRSASAPRSSSNDGFRPDSCGPEKGSFSGDQLSDSDLLGRYSDAKQRGDSYFAFWCGGHQGLSNLGSGSAPFPRERNIAASVGVVRRHAELIGIPLPPPNGGGSGSSHNTKGCKVVREFGSGNLAKESDHGGLVALFTDQKQFKKVIVIAPDGSKTGLNWSGWANPINGKDRQHWRHPKHWNQFKDNSVFKTAHSKKKTVCYRAYKAGERHD